MAKLNKANGIFTWNVFSYVEKKQTEIWGQCRLQKQNILLILAMFSFHLGGLFEFIWFSSYPWGIFVTFILKKATDKFWYSWHYLFLSRIWCSFHNRYLLVWYQIEAERWRPFVLGLLSATWTAGHLLCSQLRKNRGSHRNFTQIYTTESEMQMHINVWCTEFEYLSKSNRTRLLIMSNSVTTSFLR